LFALFNYNLFFSNKKASRVAFSENQKTSRLELVGDWNLEASMEASIFVPSR
jgi:hypothetical protein